MIALAPVSDQAMQILAGICSLLIGAAGWFYVFYSRAAESLSAVESRKSNELRVRLRRIGGVAMIGLAVAFYVGCVAMLRTNLSLFGGMMFAVLALTSVIIILALVDLRLTREIRRRQEERNRDDESPPNLPQ